MSYNYKNYVRIKSEYENNYNRRRDEADERRRQIHRLYPDIEQIDGLLTDTGMRVFEEIMKGQDGFEQRIAKIRDDNEQLQAMRADCLKYHGFPADYTDIKYDCSLCHDTGTVGTSMCVCMKRKLILAGYESSGIGNLIKTQSFEKFDLSYYSNDAAQLSAITRILNLCRKYADNFKPDMRSNMLFRGSTGLGKTHLSTSIAKVIIENGFDVVYDTAQNIFSDFEEERFGRTDGQNITGRYFDCDLLIMDDLGAELSNQFTVSCLYNIINTRINREKSMIVNTNLLWDELRKRYSDRIYSRLIGEFTILEFIGTDIRFKKLK